MSKGDTTESEIIALIFNKTLPSYLGALSSTGDANLYLALHTADPGESGTQSTSEISYGDYARVTVARTAGGWTCSGNQASNTAIVQFAEATSGSATATYVSIGLSGGQILYSGQLNAPRAISTGIRPQFAAGQLVVQED